MQAVNIRAYPAALALMDCAKKIAGAATPDDKVDSTIFMQMLYPPGSSLDNSPLHVLCCNDTCSFTWTGDEHIKQVGSYETIASLEFLQNYSHPLFMAF